MLRAFFLDKKAVLPEQNCQKSDTEKSALAELGSTTCSLQTVLPAFDPKSPVFMRVFGLSSLSKPIGKPTKTRNFWYSLTQPECSIHNAA